VTHKKTKGGLAMQKLVGISNESTNFFYFWVLLI